MATTICILFRLAWFILWAVAIVRLVQKKKGRVWLYAVGAFVVSITIAVVISGPTNSSSTSAAASSSTTSSTSAAASSSTTSSTSAAASSSTTPCSDERNAAHDALASTKAVSDAMPLSPSERNVSDLMDAAFTLGKAESSIGKCIYDTQNISDTNEDAILADDLRVLKNEIIFIHFSIEAAGESANLTDSEGRSLKDLAQLATKEANIIASNASATDDERKISAEVIEVAQNFI